MLLLLLVGSSITADSCSWLGATGGSAAPGIDSHAVRCVMSPSLCAAWVRQSENMCMLFVEYIAVKLVFDPLQEPTRCGVHKVVAHACSSRVTTAV